MRLHKDCIQNANLNCFFIRISLGHYSIITIDADSPDHKGGNKDDDGKCVAFLAKGVTANGGDDHRRNPSDRTDEHPDPEVHICKTCEVVQKVLRCSWYDIQDK